MFSKDGGRMKQILNKYVNVSILELILSREINLGIEGE